MENCDSQLTVCQLVAERKFGTIISIDGNIGTGKSSVMNSLQEGEDIMKENEPVDQWTPWLGLFYEDMEGRQLGFQFKILMSYYKVLMDYPITKNLVIERTPFTAWNIFAKETPFLDEHERDLLREYVMEFGWLPDYWIYLQCDPAISYGRISKRGREEEKGVSLDYIRLLHEKHEEVFNPKGIAVNPDEILHYKKSRRFVVNANQGPGEVLEVVNAVLAFIIRDIEIPRRYKLITVE